MPQSRRIYNKMPTPFHIECEGERLGEGKEGEFPLGSRDKTWSRVYGEPKQGWELISQFHRLISRAFTVIEGTREGRGLCISAISPAPSNNLSNYGPHLHFINQEFGSDWERIEVTFNSSSD